MVLTIRSALYAPCPDPQTTDVRFQRYLNAGDLTRLEHRSLHREADWTHADFERHRGGRLGYVNHCLLEVREDGSDERNAARNTRIEPGAPAHKWYCWSDDGGRTFTDPVPWHFESRETGLIELYLNRCREREGYDDWADCYRYFVDVGEA